MTMIEKVAQAINNHLNNIGYNLENIDIGPGLAKAAIKAMREPEASQMIVYTEMKLKTGERKAFVVSEWEMMIDAALKDN